MWLTVGVFTACLLPFAYIALVVGREDRREREVWRSFQGINRYVPATIFKVLQEREGSYRSVTVNWKVRSRHIHTYDSMSPPYFSVGKDGFEVWVNRGEERQWEQRIRGYCDNTEQLPVEIEEFV